MSLNKLLKTPQATPINDKGEPMKPNEAWTPKVVDNGDGTINLTTVKPTDDGLSTFDDLIRSEGYDPAEYMVTPNGVQVKNWEALRRTWVEDDSERGGHHVTEKTPMRGYKLTIIKRPYGAVDVDELAELVTNSNTHIEPRRGTSDFVFAVADFQAGKMDHDGPEGMLARYLEVLSKGIEESKRQNAGRIVIAFLGDCLEGNQSQGGRNMWRTVLTMTEQTRLVRRMFLRAIDAFVDAGYRDIKVVSVPGNHDEVQRTLTTRSDDSWAVDSLVAVADALELNPDHYGGVRCYVPGPDETGVALEIGGANVWFTHGHYWRPGQHWRWWEGQAFGQTEAGKCSILMCGHTHSYKHEERDVKTFVTVPPLESVSEWYLAKTGVSGNPGAFTCTIQDGMLESGRKIHALHRGERKVSRA